MLTAAPDLESLSADLGTELQKLIGVTGLLQDSAQGYRIAVYHTRAFPWDGVVKTLLYRNFQVSVGNRQADIFIDAKARAA